MNRRSVLLGLGATAAGSGIVFGSGAFTQVQAERDITIGVSTDQNALVELKPNDNIESVFQSSDGELAVDSSKLSDDDKGFNVGSTVQIGATSSPFGDEVNIANPAFEIINRFTDSSGAEFGTIDIGIDLTAVDPSKEDQIESLEFIATKYDQVDNATASSSELIKAGDRKVLTGLEPDSTDTSDDRVAVAIRVETSNTEGTFSIEDAIAIQAGSDLTADNFPNEQAAPAGVVKNQRTENTFSAIQDAVDIAGSGDTLIAGPSTFSESVKIDTENLTIKGPNAGTAGDSDQRGDEAVITSGLTIAADGVTTDGVQVENADTNGIRFGPDTVPSDVTIQNTVVTNVGGAGGSGKTAANGIQFQFTGVADETAENIQIVDNKISDISAPDTTGDSSDAAGVNVLPRGNDIVDLRIAGNSIENIQAGNAGRSEARAIAVGTQFTNTSDGDRGNFGQATGLTVENNTISDLDADFSRAVALFESAEGPARTGSTPVGPENFTIADNVISNVASNGGAFNDTAVFIGGYATLGTDHKVSQNEFRDGLVLRPTENQSGISLNSNAAASLNLVDNTFTSETTEAYVVDGSDNANLATVIAENEFAVDVEVVSTEDAIAATNR